MNVSPENNNEEILRQQSVENDLKEGFSSTGHVEPHGYSGCESPNPLCKC